MVTRALQRRGLPLALHDDLVSEVLHRVVTVAARETIENPAAFATTAAQYAAADLLRGELRRPAPLVPAPEEGHDDEPSDELVDDNVLASMALRDLRDALFDTAVITPSQAATALAFLSARVDDVPVGPHCPQPAGGAGAQEAAEWAGLWYGGRHDCFPDEADSAAVRKRRSRAVSQLHAALADAAEQADLTGAHDG
jgi:hypothetical protein